MKRILVLISLLCFSTILFCQTVKPKVQTEYKADKDTEFDKGSKIKFDNLTEHQIGDLAVLGKVWGFLKYYHPSIAEGKYNWDYELFRIMPKIFSSKTQFERNIVLSDWVEGLGKVENRKPEINQNTRVKLQPDVSWIDNSILGEKLVSQLIDIKNTKRKDDNYYVGMIKSVGNPEFKNERPYTEMKYPDTGFRMLALYRYWNIIQYFFPYKNLIGEDWNNVLTEFIPKFWNASNELEYKLTALSLISRIHDTHANIWKDATLKNYAGINYAPLELSFIENKAVVTDYYDTILGQKSGFKIGDVIEKINNKSIDKIIKERLPFASASNYPAQLRVIARDILRTNDTILSLDYKRGESKAVSNIKCFSSSKLDIYKEQVKLDTCFRFVAPGVSYIFIGNIKNSYLKPFIPEILKSKGLILDLRHYPSDNIIFSLNEYLLPQKITFSIASFASIISPGLFTITDSIESGKKNENFYSGKVVILVNENTQSQGEFTAMAFRTAPKAVIIGSTTAGADGNVSYCMLPGGVKTGFSGIGIYYPDGKETQRIGIVPDIEVKRTIQGIIENRDELLEKAIEIINEK